jgi:hypothetical protein
MRCLPYNGAAQRTTPNLHCLIGGVVDWHGMVTHHPKRPSPLTIAQIEILVPYMTNLPGELLLLAKRLKLVTGMERCNISTCNQSIME